MPGFGWGKFAASQRKKKPKKPKKPKGERLPRRSPSDAWRAYVEGK